MILVEGYFYDVAVYINHTLISKESNKGNGRYEFGLEVYDPLLCISKEKPQHQTRGRQCDCERAWSNCFGCRNGHVPVSHEDGVDDVDVAVGAVQIGPLGNIHI